MERYRGQDAQAPAGTRAWGPLLPPALQPKEPDSPVTLAGARGGGGHLVFDLH